MPGAVHKMVHNMLLKVTPGIERMVCSLLLLLRRAVGGARVLILKHTAFESTSWFVTLIVNSNSGGSCVGQVVVVMDLWLGECFVGVVIWKGGYEWGLIYYGGVAKRLLLCCGVAVGLVSEKTVVVKDLNADRY